MEFDNSQKMTDLERRATVSLGTIYAVRMLGLFMVLPVLSLYAEQLVGVTPLLVGLAIGAYGLTQALFQIPLGMLSDRVGRKPVIIGGLCVFALGSVVAAMSDSIVGVISGRALQGAGAIAAAVMALAADLTRESQRTKVMAVIGLSIGLSFSFALVAGPLFHEWIGVRGMFWLTSALALAAVGLLMGVVPNPVRTRLQRDAQVVSSAFKQVIKDPQLLRLDFGIFILHMVLTANFVVLPVVLRDQVGLNVASHWMLYLPVLFASFFMMLPFIILGEKRRAMKQVMVGAIIVLGAAEISLVFSTSALLGVTLSMLLFFAAFNLLEASLPSLVTKITAPDIKGTSIGVYSSSQFLGAFMGGVLGGAFWEVGGPTAVFLCCTVAILLWLAVSASMKNPRYLSSYLINVGSVTSEHANTMVAELARVRGVAEVVIIPEDGVAYLKVDRRELDEKRLREFSSSPA